MNVELKGLKFYAIDKDNEIEIEKDGWSVWLSITETEKLIEFLRKQIKKSKSEIDESK